MIKAIRIIFVIACVIMGTLWAVLLVDNYNDYATERNSGKTSSPWLSSFAVANSRVSKSSAPSCSSN